MADFVERINGLSNIHLVQQGAELAYLLLHDPEYRRVRREHLIEVGKRIRLKQNIQLLSKLIGNIDGRHFSFFVVSAAPQEVIQSALEGIVSEDHIFGTQFRYAPSTGEIESIQRVSAGYGKVAVVDALRSELMISHDHVVYVGDGSSDVHVMMHVNRLNGMTIAVSENKFITQIAARTVSVRRCTERAGADSGRYRRLGLREDPPVLRNQRIHRAGVGQGSHRYTNDRPGSSGGRSLIEL